MTLENFIKNEHCPKILVNYYNYITIRNGHRDSILRTYS